MPLARDYAALTEELVGRYAALPGDAPVRLAKRTSNLFRRREATTSPGLDVSGFRGVLAIDTAARTADVLGMTTYKELVDATLPHGLMPLVVPQLGTITLGGAVAGLGIESSSFRNGLPHESVLEMDVMTGDGRVVTARPEGEHGDLFHGFPNSYGTLGYALRLRIELEPVAPYVRLTHLPFADAAALFDAMGTVCDPAVGGGRGEHDGRPVDFVDATLFSPSECYLTLGTAADGARATSDYTGMGIYYRSIQQRRQDVLSTHDYLWRWDTDWFWCSRAFGAQRPAVRRLWPKAALRSDVYWRLVALEDRYGVARRIDQWRGQPPRERVIQDIEVPIERAAEFAAWFQRDIGIAPVWACPLRQRDPGATYPLYALDADRTYVNFGFWSTVALAPGQVDGHHNRLVEAKVGELGGRKSLYSTAYYDEDDFWRRYGGDTYRVLKKTYDPDGRLLDLYAKCVRRQ